MPAFLCGADRTGIVYFAECWISVQNMLELAYTSEEGTMPELIKMYIRNVALGFVAAAVFVTMLLWFNVMNLWGLVSSSDAGVLAIFMLWFMNGIVFAGVQFAWAIMAMAEDDDEPRGGTPTRVDFTPVPAVAPKPQHPGKIRVRD
jgi:hypothetical protein